MRSRSRSRYRGASSRGNASTICCAVHCAVGCSEAIRKQNLSKHRIYSTIGAPLTGIGVRKHVEGTAGTEAVSLGSDGRTVDDSGTDDSSGPNLTRGTPTRSGHARSGEYDLVSESERLSMGYAPARFASQEHRVRRLCTLARRLHVGKDA